MPSLPVFASPTVARERDPDSKRIRFKPNSVHGRSCCGGVNVRWLAAGFILGMLMFATLSVLQGDAGQWALLSKHTETQPVGSSATQDDEVVMLDGKDGQFRDAAPGWQPSDPAEQHQEAAAVQQQPEQSEQQPQERQPAEQAEHQPAEGQPSEQQPAEQAGEQPAEGQAAEQAEEQPARGQASEQQEEQQSAEQAEGQRAEVQPSEQPEQQPEQQAEGQPAEGQASEQQPGEQAVEQPAAGQASDQQEQQPQPSTAMDMLHRLGIRYHEREPGTPVSGGYDFLPPGDWANVSPRRILIYLGVNEGAEMDYVIKHDSERQIEYDLAFAFEARPEHNAVWESAVQQRSKPVVHYINKAVWWRDAVLDLGNRDQVGSVLRTKHNDFSDDSRTMQVQGFDFAAWVDANIRDDDEVTLVSDIQGAEFPVFAHLADSGLASRIDTLYLECHYLAHSNLIDAITEDSCRQLCRAVAPHVKQFYYWVGPNQDGQIVRGFEFVNKPGLQAGDCNALHVVPASETRENPA